MGRKFLKTVFCLLLAACFCGCQTQHITSYTLKEPVAATITICEVSGILQIAVRFSPSRALGTQLNRKRDRNVAEQLCIKALRRYFNAASKKMNYSQLQQRKPPVYAEDARMVVFEFSVPKSAVRME